MGCFPKHNKVGPAGPIATGPAKAPKSPRAKPKPKRKKSAASSKSITGYWKLFTAFVSNLICTKVSGTKVVPFNHKMYPDEEDSESDSSDCDSNTPGPCPSPQPKCRPKFEEVEFCLPGQASEVAPPPPAVLTVPITALPKPNECSTSQEHRTNVEIIKEFRDSGLMGYVQSAVVGENVKPNGVSFEVRLTTIRPRTAKGPRVVKPPRRLEHLEVNAIKKDHSQEITALKTQIKQEKAANKRQALQDKRILKKQEQTQKHKMVAETIAQANELKKKNTADMMALKEVRARSARLSQLIARQQRDDIKYRRRELARKSKQLSLGRPGGEVLSPDGACTDLDKLSTYGSSSGSDETFPLYYETVAHLKPVQEEDTHDEFFDGPKNEGQEN